jgi:hypothetical protein
MEALQTKGGFLLFLFYGWLKNSAKSVTMAQLIVPFGTVEIEIFGRGYALNKCRCAIVWKRGTLGGFYFFFRLAGFFSGFTRTTRRIRSSNLLCCFFGFDFTAIIN